MSWVTKATALGATPVATWIASGPTPAALDRQTPDAAYFNRLPLAANLNPGAIA
jgi:hypothetical protein